MTATEEQLQHLVDCARAPVAGGDVLVDVVTELRSLRATKESVFGVVARMHEACVGDKNGPRRGLVEDVMDLRTAAIRTRVALDESMELNDTLEKVIDDLKKARDLAAGLLSQYGSGNPLLMKQLEIITKAGERNATPQGK